MLILTRKTGQRIRVGQDIEIVVVRMKGDRVRLGIEAPAEVRILRTELLTRNDPRAANETAASQEESAAKKTA